MRLAHLVTTPPGVRLCGRCRRPVLTGVSEGLSAKADPVLLDADGQICATALGIWLYQLTPWGLHLIDQSRARSAHRWQVVPEHRCGIHWPPTVDDTSTTPSQHSTDPPY